MNDGIKAVILLSGGLDSSLAAKILKEQGIHLYAIHFTSPFCQCDAGGKCFSKNLAIKLNIPFKIISKTSEYIKIIKNPKFKYGKCINPCIDCRIFTFKKAWEFAQKIKARFLVTGEVVGQRPMSQKYNTLFLIEKQSGLEGKILRPLSAGLLPPTEAEIKGWVDRSKLLSIQGRTRKQQLSLAEEYSIQDFACPSGGCLLTVDQFAKKIKDLFLHKKNPTFRDFGLLKIGRHFRYQTGKIIVGRNETENNLLELHKNSADYIFRVKEFKGPVTILQGRKTKCVIEFSAGLTTFYSDCRKDRSISVLYGRKEPFKEINIYSVTKEESLKYNITL